MELEHAKHYFGTKCYGFTSNNRKVLLTPKNYSYVVRLELRPLSDLTLTKGGLNILNEIKKISTNIQFTGELKTYFPEGYNHIDGFTYETENYTQELELNMFFEVKDILLKNHFDVFGLIEKGLAIDINTI